MWPFSATLDSKNELKSKWELISVIRFLSNINRQTHLLVQKSHIWHLTYQISVPASVVCLASAIIEQQKEAFSQAGRFCKGVETWLTQSSKWLPVRCVCSHMTFIFLAPMVVSFLKSWIIKTLELRIKKSLNVPLNHLQRGYNLLFCGCSPAMVNPWMHHLLSTSLWKPERSVESGNYCLRGC